MDGAGNGQSEPHDHDVPPDPFSCGLITVLLVLGVCAWLVVVYFLSRGW